MNVKPLSIALAIATVLALGACSERTEQEARETGAALDNAADQAGDAASSAAADTAENIDQAAEATADAAAEAAAEIDEATEEAQDAVEEGANEAAEEMDENITTDAELSATDLLDLGNGLRSLAATGPSGATGVDFRTVPAAPQEIGGGAYVVADEAKTRRLFDRLRLGQPLGSIGAVQVGTAPSPATIKVVVLDAGGGERAEQVGAGLDRAGFVVLGVKDAPASLRRSEILFRAGRESRAGIVEAFFPDLNTRSARGGVLGGAAVAVVVGSDFPEAP